jgi:5-methylcytosine-specific restriction endonuclease McrA
MSPAYYGTMKWRVLARQCIALNPICATPGCHAPAVHADHIVPRAQGGADSLANLRGLCLSCHGTRRGTAEPVAKGAHLDGTPRDAGHWWRQP